MTAQQTISLLITAIATDSKVFDDRYQPKSAGTHI